MNIIELAKEYGAEVLVKDSLITFEDYDLQAFAQAVIENYKAGLVPVAWRSYDRNGYFIVSTTLKEAMRDFPTKEHTPLYALKETK